MAAPTFSVVIPAFNAQATVAAAVRSALAQTDPDLEVIVVDDGSTDATGDVVASVGDPRIAIVRQPNRGLPAARNAGVAAATGSYVGFLDSDDLWLPRYLELARRALTAGRRVGLVYTDAYAFDPVSGRVRTRSAMQRQRPPTPPPSDPPAFLLELLKRNFIWVSTVVPRSVLEETGGFDESRTSLEDYALWLRVLVAGYSAVCVPGQQGLYRVHPNQMSQDSHRMAVNELEVYNSLELELMPTEAHRRLLMARREAAARELALLEGRDRTAARARALRHRLGRLRKRLGLGDHWLEVAPPEVAAAFPDLKSV
jgi:glycosyltransferase involved in cell wall biosynthesis